MYAPNSPFLALKQLKIFLYTKLSKEIGNFIKIVV